MAKLKTVRVEKSKRFSEKYAVMVAGKQHLPLFNTKAHAVSAAKQTRKLMQKSVTAKVKLGRTKAAAIEAVNKIFN